MTITTKAPAQFDTGRLTLRQPHSGDAEAIFDRYASDPDVTKFVGWPRHRSLQDTRGFLQFSEHEWEQWPAGPYLIVTRSDGQVIGSTGLGFRTPHEAVTGYVLAKDAWGKGYATEALAAVVDLAAGIGVTRLFADCHREHRQSSRILEKCGFVRDGTPTWQVEFPNLSPGVLQEALCYHLALDEPGR